MIKHLLFKFNSVSDRTFGFCLGLCFVTSVVVGVIVGWLNPAALDQIESAGFLPQFPELSEGVPDLVEGLGLASRPANGKLGQ